MTCVNPWSTTISSALAFSPESLADARGILLPAAGAADPHHVRRGPRGAGPSRARWAPGWRRRAWRAAVRVVVVTFLALGATFLIGSCSGVWAA
ncbi:hypothetical protein QJS66_19935 [Kocuria rhizophila]|nr:hypothetical protein QJS66_19935 [Kocuria rhizophila]